MFVVFLCGGTKVVLILNLLVKWKLQEVPLITPDLEPPEARQGVPGPARSPSSGSGDATQTDTASPHSVLGVEGEDETEHLNWGLAGARNPRGHLQTPGMCEGRALPAGTGRRHTQADSSTRDTAGPGPSPATRTAVEPGRQAV